MRNEKEEIMENARKESEAIDWLIYELENYEILDTRLVKYPELINALKAAKGIFYLISTGILELKAAEDPIPGNRGRHLNCYPHHRKAK